MVEVSSRGHYLLRRLVAISCIALVVGCAGGSASGREADILAEERATAGGSVNQHGALIIAFRFQIGGPPEQRVRVQAVAYDFDAQETVTDLGEYIGNVVAQPAQEGELLRVTIENETETHTLRLTHRDGFLQADEIDGSGSDATTIRRVLIPEGTELRPSATPIEITR
jgi:hypothetical protein